jgi:hypothetical protein
MVIISILLPLAHVTNLTPGSDNPTSALFVEIGPERGIRGVGGVVVVEVGVPLPGGARRHDDDAAGGLLGVQVGVGV